MTLKTGMTIILDRKALLKRGVITNERLFKVVATHEDGRIELKNSEDRVIEDRFASTEYYVMPLADKDNKVVPKLTLENLNKTLDEAIEKDVNYFAVQYSHKDVTIYNAPFHSLKKYINVNIDNALESKHLEYIKITGYCYGNTYGQIERKMSYINKSYPKQTLLH